MFFVSRWDRVFRCVVIGGPQRRLEGPHVDFRVGVGVGCVQRDDVLVGFQAVRVDACLLYLSVGRIPPTGSGSR